MMLQKKNIHFKKTKKETIKHFKNMLALDDSWALRGLFRLYEFQTDEEKRKKLNTHHNGVGFTASDANILSDFVGHIKTRGHLTARQMFWLHMKMPKYANQLYKISVENNHESY